jgi:hypothetical protein
MKCAANLGIHCDDRSETCLLDLGMEYYLCVLCSCIGLLDRFLQQCINSSTAGTSFVTQKNLQLIAVAAFLIAAKVEVSSSFHFSEWQLILKYELLRLAV